MQRIIAPACILTTLLFVGCGNPGTPATDGVIADSTTVRVSTPPVQLINDLVGTWMPEDYRDCLIRQRSAFACRSMGDDIYVMYMQQAGADSLRWSYITTHEGGPEVMLAYDQQVQGFVGQPGEYSAEEMIHVRSVDPDHLELRTERKGIARRFVRVQSEQELLLSALFSGVFMDEGTGDTVRFHTNGKVTGLPGIEQAVVLTDFTEGLDDRDIVFLFTGQYDWDKDAYHFQYDEEELFLYPMQAAEEEYVYRMGEMRFHLRRL
jgi:hypothetical protein